MKPLRWSVPTILAGSAAAAGWLLERLLTGSGRPLFLPPESLAVVLAGLGILLALLAIPVRLSTRRAQQVREHPGTQRKPPVDPFYATRVLILARSGTLTGALVSGVFAGMLLAIVTPPSIPVTQLVVRMTVLLGAGLVLVVGGIIGERMCRLPPDDTQGPTAKPGRDDPAPAGSATERREKR